MDARQERVVELEDQVRRSDVWRRWEAARRSADQATWRVADDALRADARYRAWAAGRAEARTAAGPDWARMKHEIQAEVERRQQDRQAAQQRRQSEEAAAAQLRADQAARAAQGLGWRVGQARPLDPPPELGPAVRLRIEDARAWAPAELAAQVKSVEKNRVMGIPWGLKITLHNHDVMRVTSRSIRHGGTEAAVRLSAAMSREMGWRGQLLSGHPAWIQRTAVILAAEGVHVQGWPSAQRIIDEALVRAGLANPPMPPRRPESAQRRAATEKMTDELLARWTGPAQTNTPAAAPGTPAPGVST